MEPITVARQESALICCFVPKKMNFVWALGGIRQGIGARRSKT